MSQERILIDDLVILGNAVPDLTSDLRTTVCVAGYSERHGMIRIYPVPPHAQPKRWKMISVPLVKNPQDPREESWKIEGSRDDYPRLNEKITTLESIDKKSEKQALLQRVISQFGVDCCDTLNQNRESLGIITPKAFECYFKEREKHTNEVQKTLFSETKFKTINNYPRIPMIKYSCSECHLSHGHNQQIIEWGVYEWMRKYPDKIDEVWNNCRLTDPNWSHYFLVGNMARHLRSFMIISDLRFKND